MGTCRQHASHAVVLIADFRAKLNDKALAFRQICTLRRFPEGKVTQQTISGGFGTAQLFIDLYKVVAEVVL